jgi:hypothetical protein
MRIAVKMNVFSRVNKYKEVHTLAQKEKTSHISSIPQTIAATNNEHLALYRAFDFIT